ncbi:MAG: response regulator [Geopsychrobacter sp.]|nr:response regulator [Geopsychrobacter sp.]
MRENSACHESQSLLQGMADLLCNISVYSESVARSTALEISDREKDALQQTGILAQKGAETLESCALTPPNEALTGIMEDPLFITEAITTEKMIQQVALSEYLVAQILHKRKEPLSPDDFDRVYSIHKLKFNLNRLQNVFNGSDCQHISKRISCPSRNCCLISSWTNIRQQRHLEEVKESCLTSILLVDDDSLVRKATKRTLRDQNDYHLTTVDGSSKALELLGQETFDVIVADFLMPGQDGCELLAQVAQQWPDMTRILFTASVDNQRVRECLKSGKAAYIIEKPWNNEDLLSSLEQASLRTKKEDRQNST